MKIETLMHTIKLDPPTQVFAVVVSHADGEWRETFATQAERDAFVKGVRAAIEMLGYRADERPITLGKEMS